METKKHNFGGKNKGTVCHKSHNIKSIVFKEHWFYSFTDHLSVPF